MNPMRKSALSLVVVLVVGISLILVGCGQQATTTANGSDSTSSKYPTHAITLLVPHAAGGSTDIIARAFQPYLQKVLGQTVVIQNLEGAGGNQAWEDLYIAKTDGYTLGMAPFPSAILGQLVKDAKFKTMDFTFIHNVVGNDFNGIFVKYDSPYKDLKSLLDDAKTKNIPMSGSGVGTNSDMARGLLQKVTGIGFNYVPFDSGTQAAIAVAGGQTVAGVGNMMSLKQLVEQKKIRILGVFSAQREKAYPDVPTVEEQGISGVAMDVTTGIIAPPKLPADLVKKIDEAVDKAVNDPEFQKRVQSIGSEVQSLGPNDFTKVVQKIYGQADLVKDIIKPKK